MFNVLTLIACMCAYTASKHKYWASFHLGINKSKVTDIYLQCTDRKKRLPHGVHYQIAHEGQLLYFIQAR